MVACVIERDGRFLCVEEEIGGRRVFNQPAGHLDPGESLVDAAVRETLEETAWHVRIDELLGVYLADTEIAGKSFLRFCFTATALRHEPGRPLDTEIVRTHWLSAAALRERESQLRSPLVLQAIDAWHNGARYPLDLLHASLTHT